MGPRLARTILLLSVDEFDDYGATYPVGLLCMTAISLEPQACPLEKILSHSQSS